MSLVMRTAFLSLNCNACWHNRAEGIVLPFSICLCVFGIFGIMVTNIIMEWKFPA